MKFIIEEDVKKLGFPCAAFAVYGLANDPAPDFYAEQEAVLAKIIETYEGVDLKSDEVLYAYRELHDSVGVGNRKNISSPENMVAHLVKTKALPSINTVVDIYNTASLDSLLSMGAHDIENINGDVTLKFVKGDERYIPIGFPDGKQPKAGAYAYVDGANEILCYMEVRQVEKTKVTEATKDCLFLVQGNNKTPADFVRTNTETLAETVVKYCGGEVDFLYLP